MCLLHFFFFFLANAVSDGDKESECDDLGPSPDDSGKVRNMFIMKYMKKNLLYVSLNHT